MTSICLASGTRVLRLKDLGVYTEVDALVRDVFLELEQAIKDSPPAWHFWGESDRFFRV